MLKSVASRTRRLLAWWLSGSLLLTGLAGAAALIVLNRIRAGEAALRARYVERSGPLEQLRDGIYLSGTVTDPDRLKQLEAATLAHAARYPSANLRGEVITYWKLVDLMAEVSHSAGTDAYFRKQLAQRRDKMLSIVGEIDAELQRESERREAELAVMYGRFRWTWFGGLILVMSLSAGLSILSSRRLLRLEDESRALSAQLVQAQEQERRSIARELHDQVGQALSSLLLDVGKAQRAADLPELRQVAQKAEEAVDTVRSIALSLRPSMLDYLGLVAALEWQAREVGHRTGLEVRLDAEEQAGEMPDAHRTCIYRVTQEALRNCARHAAARHVRIGLERTAAAVILRVEDDGKGFAVNRQRGLGLFGMEERAAQLGGSVRVRSEPGRGTTVTAEIPL